MTPQEFDRRSAFDDDASAPPSITNQNEHQAARHKIGTGARAVNRLLLSLWFLLLPMIWPSSDWIGLIILSQAFFVAANLIKPAILSPGSAALPEGTDLNINTGEESAEG